MKDELTLKQVIISGYIWFRYLLKNWKYIVIGGILGASIGLAKSYFGKNKYKAEVTFVLEEGSSGGGLYEGIANQFGISLEGGSNRVFAGDNIIGLMNSKRMVESTLLRPVPFNNRQITLAELYIQTYDLRSTWETKPFLKDVDYPVGVKRNELSLREDSIIGVLHSLIIGGHLQVSKVNEKMSVISVVCTSNEQVFSKYFVEYLVDEVSRFYIQTKTKKMQSNLNLLQSKADSVRLELNNALRGRASIADRNQFMVRQSAAVSGVKKEIDVQVLSTMYIELIKNLEITRLSLLRETPLVQIIDSPTFPLSRMKFRKLHGVLYGGLLGGFFVCSILISILLIKKNFKKDDFRL